MRDGCACQRVIRNTKETPSPAMARAVANKRSVHIGAHRSKATDDYALSRLPSQSQSRANRAKRLVGCVAGGFVVWAAAAARCAWSFACFTSASSRDDA